MKKKKIIITASILVVVTIFGIYLYTKNPASELFNEIAVNHDVMPKPQWLAWAPTVLGKPVNGYGIIDDITPMADGTYSAEIRLSPGLWAWTSGRSNVLTTFITLSQYDVMTVKKGDKIYFSGRLSNVRWPYSSPIFDMDNITYNLRGNLYQRLVNN